MTEIDIKLVYARDIAGDGTLTAFEDLLRRSAPGWCQTMRIWTSNREQTPVRPGRLRAEIIDDFTDDRPISPLVTHPPPPESLRRFGTAELRGATPDLTLVISTDAFPYSRRSGKPALDNGITAQVRRPKVAARPVGRRALRRDLRSHQPPVGHHTNLVGVRPEGHEPRP
jgi:hypothetical protein